MTDYTDYLTLEGSERRAAQLGQVIKTPTAHELFIDIDSEEALQVFMKNYKIINDRLHLFAHYSWNASKSGLPKRHIIVRTTRMVGVMERMFLQCLLGSDITHEAHSYLAYKNDHPHPTMFFENPNGTE